MNPKPIVILGSTGSIGRQALDVARALPGELRVVGLAAHSNVELFASQIEEWKPAIAALWDEDAARQLEEVLSSEAQAHTQVLAGREGVLQVATHAEAELVLGAMLGAAGLEPTLAGIRAGKDIAIANKETLVAAGELVTSEAKKHNVQLLPVDSEHSALAQCLIGEDAAAVSRLTITASGGPFVDKPREEIAQAPASAALKHPNWVMGRKITIDSATLMNKVLECIEARWLFDVPMEQIDVVVHRQSIIHSFVTFSDASVKAQLGVPDMRLPIQWALLFPRRVAGAAPALDLLALKDLTFEKPDLERFPALAFGPEVMARGGTFACAMNAANEEAVGAFLDGRANFYGITDCVAHVLERHDAAHRPASAAPSFDDIVHADGEARRVAREWIATQSTK
jgi:1-deoxy-D-xylulose-5-phosphate reductoisomerase